MADQLLEPIVIEEADPPAAPPPRAHPTPPRLPRPAAGALACVIATGRLEDSATVTLLLALHAATLGERALCADAAGPLGQLGHLGQAASGHTLAQTANLAAREALGSRELLARAPGGISIIAAGENPAELEEDSPAPDAVRDLLAQARQVYALTAVDCGTGAGAAAVVCRQATHLIWVVRAAPGELPAAHRALRRLHGQPHAHETIVARACHPSEGRVRPRKLTALAAERDAAAVVMLAHEHLALPDDRERLLDRHRSALHQLTARIGVQR